MKGLYVFLLTIVSLNVCAQRKASVQSIKPNEKVRKEILHKIQFFTEAWAGSDTASLSKLLANEYRHTDIWGKILHRQDWLTYAAASRKISAIATDDIEILIYNDHMAIVTGKMSYKFGEEKVAQEIRFTQIWSNGDGKWKRTTFQATLIDKTK